MPFFCIVTFCAPVQYLYNFGFYSTLKRIFYATVNFGFCLCNSRTCFIVQQDFVSVGFELQVVSCRILFVCHGLLYKQLCSWLLYGCLNDPYQEFFVQLNTEDTENVSTLPSQEEEDDELPILGVTGRQLQVCCETKYRRSQKHRMGLITETPYLSNILEETKCFPLKHVLLCVSVC